MSEFKGRIVTGVSIAIIAALGLAAAVVVLSPSTSQSSSSITSTETTSASASSLASTSAISTAQTTSTSTCIAPGQPLGAFVRVLSDPGSAPIAGASVLIDEREMNIDCSDSTASAATAVSVTYTFTTNNTEWYSLQTLNAAEDQIAVTYSGHTYNLTMPLGLSIYTCGTIYVPSGVSNVTTSAQSSCATTTSSSTQSATCSITGQPGPLFLRVISDSNQAPVAGAQVTATNKPAYCGTLPATSQTTSTFTTNSSTEWYPLDTQNDAGYSFVVKYGGQIYNLTAALAPLSTACATLSVPSGRTSVSMEEFQTTCASTSMTTSSSEQQSGSLTWYATYGNWSYSVTLSNDRIQPGQNITAVFTLMNISNETQRMDIDDPLVNPIIYTQSGAEVWAYDPSTINEIENITAGQTISQQLVLPTWRLGGGDSYILTTYPGIGTPDFVVNIGARLQLNQTITVT